MLEALKLLHVFCSFVKKILQTKLLRLRQGWVYGVRMEIVVQADNLVPPQSSQTLPQPLP